MDLATLRSSLRRQRAQLPASERRKAAFALAERIKKLRLLRKGRRIAVYSAIDGEIDLRPLIRYAKRVGCVVYAPRIVSMRARKMEFIALSGAVGLFSAFGARIDARQLDVVFVPLVAFDAYGWRLGFGAGFYDRKFSFLRNSLRHSPFLIGVGYEFQKVAPQKPQPWDVLLHAVATDRRFYRCYNSSRRRLTIEA